MSEISSSQASNDLKTMGLKVTAPRLKILEIFQRLSADDEGDRRHLSAEEVYKVLLEENSDIGLATVYRVLTQFESAGILVRHHFEDDRATYELQEGRHHDHIICVQCGRIEEFVDPAIERAQRLVASTLGYELTDHSLVLYGVCESCRKAAEASSDDSDEAF